MKMCLKYVAAVGLAMAFSFNAHAVQRDLPTHNNAPVYGHRAPAGTPINAPEVDPSMAVSALALLGGTLTVLRARRKS